MALSPDGPYTNVLPAAEVRQLRDKMRGQLATARDEVHKAESHNQLVVARSHLNFVCGVMDGLGWDDLDPEVDVPVGRIREPLRSHIAHERELVAHDVSEDGPLYVATLEALLEAITPEGQS